MRSVQLLLASYLFMASATSGCGGDESCVAAEKDAAALLQSNVRIHGKDSDSVQADPCNAHMTEAECSVGSCFWCDKDSCAKKEFRCTGMIPAVDIGYTKNWWRNADTVTRPGFVTRERYNKTSQEYEACGISAAYNSLAIRAATDCWVGLKEQSAGNRLDLTDPNINSVAMDVGIDCEFGGDLQVTLSQGRSEGMIKKTTTGNDNGIITDCNDGNGKYKNGKYWECMERRTNAEIVVQYNRQLINPDSCCTKNQWNIEGNTCKCMFIDKRGTETKPTTCQGCPMLYFVIKTNSTDNFPFLRVEAAREDPTVNEMVATVNVRIQNVEKSFDDCMLMKGTQGDCLEALGATNQAAAIRSDHKLQKLCFDGTDTAGMNLPVDAMAGCDAWKECLPERTRKALQRMNNVLTMPPRAGKGEGRTGKAGKGGLIQVSGQTDELADHFDNHTGQWSTPDGFRDTCINPATIDPEFWECKCFDWIETMKTDDQLFKEVCAAEGICPDWVQSHCDPVVLQTTMTQRVEQKAAAEAEGKMVSLDDSLSGKRPCEPAANSLLEEDGEDLE